MPRKSRQKQPEDPVAIVDTLETLKSNPVIKTAAELEPPFRELIQPAPDQARPRPSTHKNSQEHPPKSHAERVRPTGPRKRAPGEAGTVYTGPNVLVKMDAETISFDIKRPLTNETRDGVEMYLTTAQQNRLVAAGFDDLSPNGDASAWMATRSSRTLAVVQQLATEIDQKGERMARGR